MGKSEKPTVAEFLPPGKKGIAEVTHFEVSRKESESTRMRAAFGHPNDLVDPGRYARLTVNGCLMMTDTQYEWRSNMHATWKANGDMLIGGLGIGMVLVPILRKPEVKSVLVVEKYQDVIDIVLPALKANVTEASKLTVVCSDILEWKPPTDAKWDAMYFDIWTDVCTDNLKDMSTLKRRFSRRLRKGDGLSPWIGCWEEEALRYRQRQEKRSGW